jgi:N-acetylneuraminic acid mutarotase
MISSTGEWVKDGEAQTMCNEEKTMLTGIDHSLSHRLSHAFVWVLAIWSAALGMGMQVLAHPLGVLAWETKAPVIDVADVGAGVEGAAAGLIAGKIYVSHGHSFGDTNALRIYDIATDTWTTGAMARLARSELGGAVVDEKFYAIGGRGSSVAGATEIYDPIKNRWSPGKPMPTPRAGFGIVVFDGRIHVLGGRQEDVPQSGKALDTHEVYDPRLGRWFKKAPMWLPVMDNYATVALHGKIYVFGGFDGEHSRASTQIYDAATDSWSLGSPMPTARSNAIAGLLNGHPIVIGGLAEASVSLDVVEIYHPESDSWTIGPTKPTPASEMASGAPNTESAIYAIGSGPFGVSLNPNEVLSVRACLPGRDLTVSWVRIVSLSRTTASVLLGVNNFGCETAKASVRLRAIPPLRISPPSKRVSLQDGARTFQFVISKLDPQQTYELRACVTAPHDIRTENDCTLTKIEPVLPSSTALPVYESKSLAFFAKPEQRRVIASVRWQIFDLRGRSLIDETAESDAWEKKLSLLSQGPLASGVYLYVLTTQSWNGQITQRHVKKLVVQR